jgi:hypothetical protein
MGEMLTIPMQGPAVWLGSELTQSDEWIYEFTDAEIDELREVCAVVTADDPHHLDPNAFSLPCLTPRIDQFTHELDHGRGFVVLRGLPMDDGFDRHDAAVVFWLLCSRIGQLVPTVRDGTLLNHVYDRGPRQHPNDRLYTTNVGGMLHTDGVEIVGLMCLQPSLIGGASIIASSMTVYNTVLAEHPEWLPILYKRFACDWKNEGPDDSPGWYPLALYCHVDGWLSATLKTGFHRSAQRFDAVAALSNEELTCFEYLESVPERPGMMLEMALQAGDIQLVNNYMTLHSRQPYEDDPDDPQGKRHMLRYWISRTGISPRRVSADFQFLRDDYFGLTGPPPVLAE